MLEMIQSHLLGVLAALTALVVISLILAIAGLISIAILRHRTKKWRSIHATADLDAVYDRTLDEVERLRETLRELDADLQSTKQTLKLKVSTPQILRYNAFSEQGSDLSFSVALLDDNREGVVISSIYGREESRTYAKPIRSGKSSYPLTNEEMDAVTLVAATREHPE